MKKEHPFFRLDGTKNESNSYANNEQIRWGSAIFLTKENTDDDKKFHGRMRNVSNLKLQSEVLLLSSYCKILNELFHVQRELTLPKTVVYAYLIKKEDVENFKIYNAKNTKDLMYKSLSILAGDEYFFL